MKKHFEIGEEVVAIESYGYIQQNDVGIVFDTTFYPDVLVKWSAEVMERAYEENKSIHKDEPLISIEKLPTLSNILNTSRKI